MASWIDLHLGYGNRLDSRVCQELEMRNEKLMKIVAWTAVVAMVLTVIVSLVGFLS